MSIVWLVIPCYNEQEVLPETSRQLKEIMQGLMEKGKISRESRIAFVNDGSKDNSLQILQQYAAKDKRFSIINQENQGLSMARNNGLKQAKG